MIAVVDDLPPELDAVVSAVARGRFIQFLRTLRAVRHPALWRQDVLDVLFCTLDLFRVDRESTIAEAFAVPVTTSPALPGHDAAWELHAERFLQERIEQRLRPLLDALLDPARNPAWESAAAFTLQFLNALARRDETTASLAATTLVNQRNGDAHQ